MLYLHNMHTHTYTYTHIHTHAHTRTHLTFKLSNEDAYIHMSSASPPVHSPPVDMGYKGHKVPVEIRRKAPPSIALLHSRDSLTPTPQIPTYSIPSAHTSSVSNMLAAPRSPLTSSPNPVRAHSPFNVGCIENDMHMQ